MKPRSRKFLREDLKLKYVEQIFNYLDETEEILRVGSNELAFPVVDEEGNEDFIVLVVKIPTGSNKGTEPYDGYAMAEDYELKQKNKVESKIKADETKAKKIARDIQYRKKVAEMKEKKEKEVVDKVLKI